MTRQRIVVTTAVAVAAFVSGGWFMSQGSRGQGGATVYQQAKLFDDVMSHIADYYVDTLSEARLYNMAITGMVRQLHDPYSVFLTGRDLRSLDETTTGNYAGLGIQIQVRDNAVVIVAPLPDSPAEKAGLMTGDRIVEVNGQSTAQWTSDQAVRNLRGPVNSQVTIKVQRPGVPELITFTVTRARIHNRSVQAVLMASPHVGYVELNPFSEESADELTAAIDSLKGVGMHALILDLRGNPGGLLDEGIAVAELFLQPGQEVVATRGRAPGSSHEYFDHQPERYPGLPLVVLVNDYTASASEIVAGALQDHDRALVIGQPTFGKGLVQTLFQLTPDAALKITTARWYTPSGRSIQRTAANEEAQIAQADSAAVLPDTGSPAKGEVYRTDDGRVVLGGGGITPDIVVRPDSADQVALGRLNAALGKNVPVFNNVLAAYALDARGRHLVSTPTFTVTPAMRDAFLAMLARRGVRLDAATVAATRSFLDEDIGYEVAQFTFGRVGSVRRLFLQDPVLKIAERYAAEAKTPADLLTLADTAAKAPAPRR